MDYTNITRNSTYNETFEQQVKDYTIQTEHIIIRLIIAASTMLGNLLIMLTIRKSISLHRVTFYLLGNLALADFLSGIALGLRNIFALYGILYGYRCLVMRALIMMSAQSSLTGTLLLCVQNFLCVRYEDRFRSGLPKRFAGLSVAFSWLLWSILAICASVFNDPGLEEEECFFFSQSRNRALTPILVVLTVIQVVTLITLQIRTLNIIHEKRNFLRNSRRENFNPSTVAQSNAGLHRLDRMSKIVNIVRIILVLWFIFWCPVIIGMLLFYLCPQTCGVDVKILHILGTISTLNSFVNIFIYYTKSKEFHNALMDLICCFTNRIGVV